MPLGGRIDLVRPIDCVRLSLHGGSLLAGFRPGLVTTRFPRAVRSRRSQISTVSGTSPQPKLTPLTPSRILHLVTVPPKRSMNKHVMRTRRISTRRGRHLLANRPDEPRA